MKLLSLFFLACCSSAFAQNPVGDGKADDTGALQRLLETQGSVRLAKGTYRLTSTLKVDLAKSGPCAITSDGTARLVMEGAGPAILFTGNHGGTADPKTVKPEVWERERMPVVEGVEIIGANAEADGIEATGTMQLTLRGVSVRKCRHAVHLTKRNRNVLIADCHFYENTGIGVFLDNVNLHQTNIVGSHISYNRGGGVVSKGGEVRNLHIGTCDIEANHSEQGPPSANVTLDSTGGSIAEVAITGCTLQHTHKAKGSANIRILGAGFDPSLERRQARPHTREGNVTITGNVFSDVEVNIEVRDARGVVITGNTFWEGFEHDLLAVDCSNLLVSGNNFDRNPRYLVNGYALSEKNGIVLQKCVDSSFSGNIVSGVQRKRAAVDVEGCNRMRICDNSILDSDGNGLRLEKVTASIVRGNLIRDDRDAAVRTKELSILAVDSADTIVEGNVVSHLAR